jgi:hypothetical protein
LVAFLPFGDATFNYISRVLSEHNIMMMGPLPRKLSTFLQPIKDDLALKMLGVYSIPMRAWESVQWTNWTLE